MASTKELLELTTKGAVVRMVNDANQTVFNGGPSGALVISPPLSVGGRRTEVELSIRRRMNVFEELPYQGRVAFRYNRLDVAANLEGRLEGFRPTMPSSTQVLLDELTRRTGIRFELEDFVLEDIIRTNASPYVLKAKEESLRWYGSMEIQLIDLVNLATYIPPGLPAQPPVMRFTPIAVKTTTHMPYLNATSHKAVLDRVVVGSEVAVDFDELVTFVRASMGEVGTFLQDSSGPWHVSPVPGPYNLMGAQLIAKGVSRSGLNLFVPGASKVARIELGSHETLFSDKQLQIPYGEVSFNASEFNDTPRLKSSAVVNASDGTPWNIWLNNLPAPAYMPEIPSAIDLRFSGPDRWVTDPAHPGPTNLHEAVIQYNGPRRPQDVRPYHDHCNRVLVLTMGEHNTAYQGNLTFHYRAPIVINESLPEAFINEDYNAPLDPREGTAPYVFTRVSGNLAPGHSIASISNSIIGETTSVGQWTAVYDVRDSAGVTVRYTISYRTSRRPLTLQGSPQTAVNGQPYETYLDISYADGPLFVDAYSFDPLPEGLTVTLVGNQVRIQWERVNTTLRRISASVTILELGGRRANWVGFITVDE